MLDIIKKNKHYKTHIQTEAIIPTAETKNCNIDTGDKPEAMPVCFNVYKPNKKLNMCNYSIIDRADKWEKDSDKYSVYISTSYNSMRQGVFMFINILMALLAIFALLIIIIAIVVIRFSINMSLENNLANIGILESMGYTSSGLRLSAIMEYIVITIAGIAAGLLLAAGVSEQTTLIVSKSVGLRWDSKIDFTVVMFTVAAIILMVLLMTLSGSSKIKRILPLDALRNGIHTHNFTRNYLPFSKSRLEVNTIIGIKSALRQKKNNISMALIIALIVFAGMTIFTVYYNFVVEQESIIKLVGIEKTDITVKKEQNGTNDDLDMLKMCNEYVKDDNIQNAITYAVPIMT